MSISEQDFVRRTFNRRSDTMPHEDEISVPTMSYDNPVTLYKGEGRTLETRVVHSQKQHKLAVKDGFGFYNPAACVYPKSMYDRRGQHAEVWDGGEESFLREKGWQDRPFETRGVQDRPTQPEPTPETEDRPAQAASSEIDQRVTSLESRIGGIDAKVDAVLAAIVGNPSKAKRAPRTRKAKATPDTA